METHRKSKEELKRINDSLLGTGQFTDTEVTKNGRDKHVRGYAQLQNAIYKRKHPKVE